MPFTVLRLLTQSPRWGSLDEQNPQVAARDLARSGLFQRLLVPKRCVATSFRKNWSRVHCPQWSQDKQKPHHAV